MQCRRICTGVFSAAGVFLLIIDGQTAIKGAAEGIDICIRAVIPSLFPFFVLGNLLIGALLGCRLPLLTPLGNLFGIPKGTESLLLIGLLGGYPVGAQTIAQAYRSGQLTKQDARRMITFCNQTGPAFLFGILGNILSPAKAWLLWLIQIISALLVAKTIPSSESTALIKQKQPSTLPYAVNTAIRTMANVCSWVVLFRICIAFLDRWVLWFFPNSLKVGIIGLIELANGCLEIKKMTDPAVQMMLCSGILGFGGLCVTMQTVSVTSGLDLHLYFPGKILQASIAMLICWVLFPSGYLIPAVLLPILWICVIYLRKSENRGRNPVIIGV